MTPEIRVAHLLFFFAASPLLYVIPGNRWATFFRTAAFSAGVPCWATLDKAARPWAGSGIGYFLWVGKAKVLAFRFFLFFAVNLATTLTPVRQRTHDCGSEFDLHMLINPTTATFKCNITHCRYLFLFDHLEKP